MTLKIHAQHSESYYAVQYYWLHIAGAVSQVLARGCLRTHPCGCGRRRGRRYARPHDARFLLPTTIGAASMGRTYSAAGYGHAPSPRAHLAHALVRYGNTCGQAPAWVADTAGGGVGEGLGMCMGRLRATRASCYPPPFPRLLRWGVLLSDTSGEAAEGAVRRLRAGPGCRCTSGCSWWTRR
jgi:hypothetical protein